MQLTGVFENAPKPRGVYLINIKWHVAPLRIESEHTWNSVMMLFLVQ